MWGKLSVLCWGATVSEAVCACGGKPVYGNKVPEAVCAWQYTGTGIKYRMCFAHFKPGAVFEHAEGACSARQRVTMARASLSAARALAVLLVALFALQTAGVTCPEGMYLQTMYAGDPCHDCASCPSGYERKGCGGESPGTCEPCMSGEVKPFGGVHDCVACGSWACLEGHERRFCGGSSVGGCIRCEYPTYNPTQYGDCIPCPNCPPGQRRLGCGWYDVGVCRDCAEDTYSTSDGLSCSQCSDLPDCPTNEVRYNCGGSIEGDCVSCNSFSACPTGYRRNGCGPGTSLRICEACTQCSTGETFAVKQCASPNKWQDVECKACTTECEQGSYISVPCTLTHDATCSVCLGCDASHYRVGCGGSSEGSCEPCANAPACAHGYFRTGCGGGSIGSCTCHENTQCSETLVFECDDGFVYDGASRSCVACDTSSEDDACSASRYFECNGDLFYDGTSRSCVACGTACADTEVALVGSCNTWGDTQCVQCPEGTQCSCYGTAEFSCAVGSRWNGQACAACTTSCSHGWLVQPRNLRLLYCDCVLTLAWYAPGFLTCLHALGRRTARAWVALTAASVLGWVRTRARM